MKGRPPVDRAALRVAIHTHVVEIRKRLDDAATIARAAEMCAAAGNIDEAIRVVLRFEPLTYEADRLLSAATVLRRLSKE